MITQERLDEILQTQMAFVLELANEVSDHHPIVEQRMNGVPSCDEAVARAAFKAAVAARRLHHITIDRLWRDCVGPSAKEAFKSAEQLFGAE